MKSTNKKRNLEKELQHFMDMFVNDDWVSFRKFESKFGSLHAHNHLTDLREAGLLEMKLNGNRLMIRRINND